MFTPTPPASSRIPVCPDGLDIHPPTLPCFASVASRRSRFRASGPGSERSAVAVAAESERRHSRLQIRRNILFVRNTLPSRGAFLVVSFFLHLFLFHELVRSARARSKVVRLPQLILNVESQTGEHLHSSRLSLSGQPSKQFARLTAYRLYKAPLQPPLSPSVDFHARQEQAAPFRRSVPLSKCLASLGTARRHP